MIGPITIGLMVAVGVVGLLLAFVFKGDGSSSTSERLDVLVGKRRNDSSPELLRDVAFEGGAKGILEKVAARIPNLQKLFEQADCHIKPNTLVVLGLVFGGLGVTGSFLAGVPVVFVPIPGMILFLIPFGWLWNKR